MSVDTNLHLGWVVVLEEGSNPYDKIDQMDSKWMDFIVGTDPMCGRNNHVCIVQGFNKHIPDDGEGFFLEGKDMGVPDEIPAKITEFLQEYRETHGDDSIVLKYGLLQWFN